MNNENKVDVADDSLFTELTQEEMNLVSGGYKAAGTGGSLNYYGGGGFYGGAFGDFGA